MSIRSESEFLFQRNCELARAYHHALERAKFPFRVSQLFEETVKTPCSRFWITPRNARRVISDLNRGTRFQCSPSLKRMIDEILRRCGGTIDYEKLDEVIYSPAPEFYITAASAQIILCKFDYRKYW